MIDEACCAAWMLIAYFAGVLAGVLVMLPWAFRRADCPLCRKFARMWEKKDEQ